MKSAPLNTDTWATIAANRTPVDNGPLGQWDTTTLAPGDYQLRLVVVRHARTILTALHHPFARGGPIINFYLSNH